MIKILIKTFLLCSILLFFVQCDSRSERAKLAHQAMYNAASTLENRYQMKFIGWSEGADEVHYKRMGLNFQVFRVLSKSEGRKMLIDSVNELLKEINTLSELQSFLNPAPFSPLNVEIHIFDYQPDGKDVYYPNIVAFTAYKGNLRYKTKIPENEFGYYTKESETYEEALSIVNSQ